MKHKVYVCALKDLPKNVSRMLSIINKVQVVWLLLQSSSFSLEAEPDNDDYDESDIEGNIEHNNNTINGTGADEQDPMFPPDLFTKEQIKSGAVIFYILGKNFDLFRLMITCFFLHSDDISRAKWLINQ